MKKSLLPLPKRLEALPTHWQADRKRVFVDGMSSVSSYREVLEFFARASRLSPRDSEALPERVFVVGLRSWSSYREGLRASLKIRGHHRQRQGARCHQW
jgi:hypothetical protein